jgi:hypothetical protein
MSTRLAAFLRRYASLQQAISLRAFEDLLRRERYTGAVTYHYRNGVALRVEAGRPLTVGLLTEGEAAPIPGKLAEDLTSTKS